LFITIEHADALYYLVMTAEQWFQVQIYIFFFLKANLHLFFWLLYLFYLWSICRFVRLFLERSYHCPLSESVGEWWSR